MAIALADPIAALREEARQRARRTFWFLRARRVTQGWQHYEEQRMLRAVQAIDHPGVLADMQVACGPSRR